jgi:hypothetical protein
MHKDLKKETRKHSWKKQRNGGSHEIWGPTDVEIGIPLPSGTKLSTYAVRNAISAIKRTERKAQKMRDADTEEVVELKVSVVIDPTTPYGAVELAGILEVSTATVYSASRPNSNHHTTRGYAIFRRDFTPELLAEREWPKNSGNVFHAVPPEERHIWIAKFAALDAGEEVDMNLEERIKASTVPPSGPSKELEEMKLELELYVEQLGETHLQLEGLREENISLEEQLRVAESNAEDATTTTMELAEQVAGLKSERDSLLETLKNAEKKRSKSRTPPSSAVEAARDRVIETVLGLREGMKYDEERQVAYIAMSGWVKFQNALIDLQRNGG